MSVNDLMYWILPDGVIEGQFGQGGFGKEEIDTETDPPTVKAEYFLNCTRTN